MGEIPASFVAPLLSWISWMNIISGVLRYSTMCFAMVGRCADFGVRFSTL